MRADLHMHSVYSDGKYTPAALAEMAKRQGVQLASVTDHDNFLGGEEKRNAFENAGMVYLSGVEISAYEQRTKVHITGYAFDAESPLCAAYQAERVRLAEERLLDVLERLKRYKNISLPAQAVRDKVQRAGSPVHTMHVVLALVERGYFPSIRAAFSACFRPDSPTYSYVGRPTPDEAIAMLHSLGGIACIAHPGRISLPFAERETLIRSLKERGADGIECIYSTHTEEQTAYFKRLADELGLLQTGGSDFHSEGSRVVGMPPFEPDAALLNAVRLGR